MAAAGNTENYRLFEGLVAKTGGTYAFDGESSVTGFGVLLDIIRDMGLNPMITEDFKKAILHLFHVEMINIPDFSNGRFLLAPNHVSDLDAIILGLLHPRIKIVSKDAWTKNESLRQFLDLHYDLCGLDRTSLQSLRRLLTDAIRYFNDSDENKHYLVFSQGTISDFHHNSTERISTIVQKIASRTGVPVVNIFVEQPSLSHPTRIVFDTPRKLSPKDDFRTLWLEREAALESALPSPARAPKLTHKHANNNKPGDPFF